MSEQQSPLNSTRSGVTQNYFLTQVAVSAFTILMLMLCWSVFVWLGIGSLLTQTPTPRPGPKPGPDPNPIPVVVPNDDPPPPTDQEHAVLYTEAEHQLLLNLQRLEISPRLNALQASCKHAQQLEAAWRQMREGLMTSTEGKRLATETAARKVKFLDTTVLGAVSELSRIGEWQASLEETLANARRPITDVENIEEKLLQVESQLSAGIGILEQSMVVLNKMLTSATEPQDRTLEATLSMLDQEATQHVAKELTQRLTTLEASLGKDAAAATERQSSLKEQVREAESLLENVRTESARQLSDAETGAAADAKRLAEQKTEAKRRMETELPAVRSLLSPFITPGYRQPHWEYQHEITTTSAPMSYTGLIRVRALEDNMKGLEILLMLADSDKTSGRANDRPVGSFPDYSSEFDIKNPQIVKTLKVAQDFLRQHGEAMVEAKLLSP